MRRTQEPVSINPPPVAAWDFDLDGCPKEELEHCCFYEYALESPATRKLVELWREKRRQSVQSADRIGNLIRDRWYGPSRVLVDYPEFPRKHWLEIDPHIRRQRVKKLPPYSKMSFPSTQRLNYAGPQRAHMIRLRAAQAAWQTIREEKDRILDLRLTAAQNARSLRSLPIRVGGYLSQRELTIWRKKLAKLSGGKLRRAADELVAQCDKRIEKRNRQPQELVAYEVDWTLRPHDLVEAFRQWAEVNRVHDPRPRSGGHQTKAVELLKALGAKRLLEWFRANWTSLPKKYRDLTFEAAVSRFTIDQRKAAGRPAVSPYKTRKGWSDAEARAAAYLQNFV